MEDNILIGKVLFSMMLMLLYFVNIFEIGEKIPLNGLSWMISVIIWILLWSAVSYFIFPLDWNEDWVYFYLFFIKICIAVLLFLLFKLIHSHYNLSEFSFKALWVFIFLFFIAISHFHNQSCYEYNKEISNVYNQVINKCQYSYKWENEQFYDKIKNDFKENANSLVYEVPILMNFAFYFEPKYICSYPSYNIKSDCENRQLTPPKKTRYPNNIIKYNNNSSSDWDDNYSDGWFDRWYERASENEISNPDSCNNNSDSFQDWCLMYIDEQ